jgi:hypothetical protein
MKNVVTSQKATFFIVTVVKTPKLTLRNILKSCYPNETAVELSSLTGNEDICIGSGKGNLTCSWLNNSETIEISIRTTKEDRQSMLVSATSLGSMTRFLSLSHCCLLLEAGRSLWREDRSVVYNCCGASQEQSFSGLTPIGPNDCISTPWPSASELYRLSDHHLSTKFSVNFLGVSRIRDSANLLG